MSSKAENQMSKVDMMKWALVVILLAGAVVGNSMLGHVSTSFRAIGVIVLVLVAAFVASKTEKGAQFLGFAKDSRTEVRKVVWPTRKEAMHTTLIVLAATLAVALLLWGLDAILMRIVGFAAGMGL